MANPKTILVIFFINLREYTWQGRRWSSTRRTAGLDIAWSLNFQLCLKMKTPPKNFYGNVTNLQEDDWSLRGWKKQIPGTVRHRFHPARRRKVSQSWKFQIVSTEKRGWDAVLGIRLDSGRHIGDLVTCFVLNSEHVDATWRQGLVRCFEASPVFRISCV